MNWIAFGIVAYFSLLLQSSLGPHLELFGSRPDLLLCIATFLGLYARRPEAIAGAFVLGLAADLLTIERFGVLAASYGLVTLGIASVREFLFRYRPTTQFATTFVSAIALHLLWSVYDRIAHGVGSGAPFSIYQAFFGSLFSAFLALPVHRGLLRVSRFLGLPSTRYGLSGA